MARHVPAGRVFGTDWTNLDQVILLAKLMGGGQLVVKHACRSNYNITHKARRDLWSKPGVIVLFDTDNALNIDNA